MSSNKIAYIVGAGGLCPGDLGFEKHPGDFIIAADAGYLALQREGIKPDLVISDFDSMKEREVSGRLIRLPVEKDDTDSAYAVREAFRLGYKEFVLLGALGGKRISHSIANIELLAFIRSLGGNGILKYGDTTVRLLYPGEVRIFDRKEEIVSLFSFSEKAEVCIRGLYYSGERILLKKSFPLGVSNHLAGKEASVSVICGEVLLVEEKEE